MAGEAGGGAGPRSQCQYVFVSRPVLAENLHNIVYFSETDNTVTVISQYFGRKHFLFRNQRKTTNRERRGQVLLNLITQDTSTSVGRESTIPSFPKVSPDISVESISLHPWVPPLNPVLTPEYVQARVERVPAARDGEAGGADVAALPLEAAVRLGALRRDRAARRRLLDAQVVRDARLHRGRVLLLRACLLRTRMLVGAEMRRDTKTADLASKCLTFQASSS